MRPKQSFKKTYQHFYEKQRFRNLPLLILLVLIELVMVYLVIEEVMADNLWGSRKQNSWMLIAVTLLIPTPLLLSFYLVRLETIVTEEGVFYRWFPFRKNYHMVMWENVKEVFVVDLKSSGNMWRFTNKYDETHFPGSDYGLMIMMKSGKKKLIGTRKAEELNRVLIRNSGGRYHSTFVEQYNFDD